MFCEPVLTVSVDVNNEPVQRTHRTLVSNIFPKISQKLDKIKKIVNICKLVFCRLVLNESVLSVVLVAKLFLT